MGKYEKLENLPNVSNSYMCFWYALIETFAGATVLGQSARIVCVQCVFGD